MPAQELLFASSSAPQSVAMRPYQHRGVDAARLAYRQGARAILIVLPTGGGKTRIGVEFCNSALDRGGQVLWLAHRAELLKQARDRLVSEGVPRVGIVAPWADPDAGAPIQVASVQTLVARLRKRGLTDFFKPRVVVLDEAHHYAADEWREVAAYFAGATLLGLTATPERGDGRPLDLFDTLIAVASVRELIDLGHLVPCLVIAPSSVRKDLAEDPVEAYLDRVPDERAFVFAANVPAAIELSGRYTAAGVASACIHGGTSDDDRGRILTLFRRGVVKALVNVYCLTEGVDVPEASACILARGCDAAGTYIQMVGRVLRPAPGKTRATLIDLRGVVHLHGLPDADREYSLTGTAISLTGEKKPVVLVCKRCDAACSAWRVRGADRTCPNCGAPAPPPKKPRVSREQLNAILLATPQDKRVVAYAKLLEQAKAKGYKPGWASHRYKVMFGTWPPRGT